MILPIHTSTLESVYLYAHQMNIHIHPWKAVGLKLSNRVIGMIMALYGLYHLVLLAIAMKALI